MRGSYSNRRGVLTSRGSYRLRRTCRCAAASLTGSPARPRRSPRRSVHARRRLRRTRPDGFVLWTRLAPATRWPTTGSAGIGQRRTEVEWELAADERFTPASCAAGSRPTGPELAHSVHVELAGLPPGREYHYRFRALGAVVSRPAGPAPRRRSCGAAPADPLLHLLRAVRARLLHRLRPAGSPRTAGPGAAPGRLPVRVRRGRTTWPRLATRVPRRAGDRSPSPTTGCRTRSTHRPRPAGRARGRALGRRSSTITRSTTTGPTRSRSTRRPRSRLPRPAGRGAAGVLGEHAAARGPATEGIDMRLYRAVSLGPDCATLPHARHPAVPRRPGVRRRAHADCPERTDPVAHRCPDRSRSAGSRPALRRSRARWDVLGQQVFFSQVDLTPGPGRGFNLDVWDGYPASRDRVVDSWVAARRATRWC